jgi:hypothetical protein
MGPKDQPGTLARMACTQIFSVPLMMHCVYAQGGGRPAKKRVEGDVEEEGAASPATGNWKNAASLMNIEFNNVTLSQ